jgi:hypothetical protein
MSNAGRQGHKQGFMLFQLAEQFHLQNRASAINLSLAGQSGCPGNIAEAPAHFCACFCPLQVRYHVSKDGTQVVCWCTDSVPFPNLVFVDALNSTKNSV